MVRTRSIPPVSHHVLIIVPTPVDSTVRERVLRAFVSGGSPHILPSFVSCMVLVAVFKFVPSVYKEIRAERREFQSDDTYVRSLSSNSLRIFSSRRTYATYVAGSIHIFVCKNIRYVYVGTPRDTAVTTTNGQIHYHD